MLDMSIKDMSSNRAALEAPLLESLMRVRKLIYLQAVQALKPLGLGPKQAALLRRLRLLGPDCCLSELSKATASDPAAVGRTVDGLIRKGWVRAVKPEAGGDRRRRPVALTPAGDALASKVAALFRDLDRRMAATLKPDQAASLKTLLDAMAERLA